jgi:hypothetical protein
MRSILKHFLILICLLTVSGTTAIAADQPDEPSEKQVQPSQPKIYKEYKIDKPVLKEGLKGQRKLPQKIPCSRPEPGTLPVLYGPTLASPPNGTSVSYNASQTFSWNEPQGNPTYYWWCISPPNTGAANCALTNAICRQRVNSPNVSYSTQISNIYQNCSGQYGQNWGGELYWSVAACRTRCWAPTDECTGSLQWNQLNVSGITSGVQ